MPDDPKDFLPEPQMECMECETIHFISDMAVAQVINGKKIIICKECMQDCGWMDPEDAEQ